MLPYATWGDVVGVKAVDFLKIWAEHLSQFLYGILGDRKSAAVGRTGIGECPYKHQAIFRQ